MKTKSKQKWIKIEGRFNVAGVQYWQYKLCVGSMKGKVVKLIGEPRNKYDNMAIRIDYAGLTLGYIPRGTIQQSEAWKAHENGYKIIGVITSFSKKDPTWCAITVQLYRTDKPRTFTSIPTEIDFTK